MPPLHAAPGQRAWLLSINSRPVQALTIAGAKMSQADKIAPQLKRWLGTLDKWSSDQALEARVRFKIKDLSDQVKMDWQARRSAQNTVKKTEDIRKEAHAELGMVQTAVPDYLPGLNIGSTAVASTREVRPHTLPQHANAMLLCWMVQHTQSLCRMTACCSQAWQICRARLMASQAAVRATRQRRRGRQRARWQMKTS